MHSSHVEHYLMMSLKEAQILLRAIGSLHDGVNTQCEPQITVMNSFVNLVKYAEQSNAIGDYTELTK